MSLIFTHTTEAQIKGVALVGNSDAQFRGLPPPWPLSATWACYPLDLVNDYYDIFSYGPNPFSSSDYYMAATVNFAGGPLWNLGSGGADFHGPQVVSNQWYYQGFRVMKDDAGTIEEHFHYDLANNLSIDNTEVSQSGYFVTPGATHSLVIGDAPWAVDTAATENWNGYIQGVKVWSAYLSVAELWAESQSIWPILPKYFGALWAVLPLRMVGDYSIPGMDARNKRHWTVPSTTNFPTSGGPTAPLQNRGTLFYYPEQIFSAYQLPAAATPFDWIPAINQPLFQRREVIQA